MNYELMEIGPNYDRKSQKNGRVYGEKGDHAFWPSLEESENEYEPPKDKDETGQ